MVQERGTHQFSEIEIDKVHTFLKRAYPSLVSQQMKTCRTHQPGLGTLFLDPTRRLSETSLAFWYKRHELGRSAKVPASRPFLYIFTLEASICCAPFNLTGATQAYVRSSERGLCDIAIMKLRSFGMFQVWTRHLCYVKSGRSKSSKFLRTRLGGSCVQRCRSSVH